MITRIFTIIIHINDITYLIQYSENLYTYLINSILNDFSLLNNIIDVIQ